MRGREFIVLAIAVLEVFGIVGVAASARAASIAPIHCAFGACSAQIGASALLVSCDGWQIYSGAYSAISDLRTTKIEASEGSGPEITLHGALAFGAHLNAELLLSGRSIAGSCVIPK